MALTKTLAPELPYLRRFARSLTGEQNAGDAYALAALEAIAAEPKILDLSLEPRVALYQVFISVWKTVSINDRPLAKRSELDPADERQVSARSFEAITPLPRVAFLLHAVEEFTLEQISDTLKLSVGEVETLLRLAGEEIAAQIATDVLIIEDEPVIAMDLEALVTELGHRVIGIARTHKEAVAVVKRARPGLVLADIQLADGSSGLNAVNEILAEIELPVIFITAYPEQLLTGAAPEPAFLITKPFRADTVRALMSQALFFQKNSHVPAKVKAVG